MAPARWLIMSGHSWETWETWHEYGFMAYGWSDRIGNFRDFSSQEQIQIRLKRYNIEHPEAKQGATTYERVSKEIWQFLREIKIGDIIYVKGKNNTIVGRGTVASEHIYDPEYDDKHGYSNIRKVEWSAKVVGQYPSDKNTSNHALINISDWSDEFLERLDELFDIADNYEQIKEEIKQSHLKGATRDVVVKIRVNQGVYRDRLLRKYGKCCLCKVDNEAFLIASHIKPWRDSIPEEQMDIDNGLLLCPCHDALFDKGFISFKDSGDVMISDRLTHVNQVFMNIYPDMSVELSEGNIKYMAYHREMVFK